LTLPHPPSTTSKKIRKIFLHGSPVFFCLLSFCLFVVSSFCLFDFLISQHSNMILSLTPTPRPHTST
jgi:hypothetical protein